MEWTDGQTDGHAHARVQNFDRHETSLPPTAPPYCQRPSTIRWPQGPLPSFLPSFFPSLFLSFAPASFAARQRVSLGRIASGSDTLSLASTAPPSPAARRLRPISSNTQRRRRSFSKWDLRGRLTVCAFVRAPFYCISQVVCSCWRSFGSEIFSLLPAHCPINEMREEV